MVATLMVETADQQLSFTLSMAPGQWVRVLLRDAQGITAVTNPIYARNL